jgi:hypothetical protein
MPDNTTYPRAEHHKTLQDTSLTRREITVRPDDEKAPEVCVTFDARPYARRLIRDDWRERSAPCH